MRGEGGVRTVRAINPQDFHLTDPMKHPNQGHAALAGTATDVATLIVQGFNPGAW